MTLLLNGIQEPLRIQSRDAISPTSYNRESPMRLSPVLNFSSTSKKSLRNDANSEVTSTCGGQSAIMPAHHDMAFVASSGNSHSHEVADDCELTDDELLEQFKFRIRRRLSSTTEEAAASDLPQPNSPRRGSLNEIASVSFKSPSSKPSSGGSSKYARRFSTPQVFTTLSQVHSTSNGALDFEQLKAKLENLTGTISVPDGKVEGLVRRERRDSMPVVKFFEKRDSALDACKLRFDGVVIKNVNSEPRVSDTPVKHDTADTVDGVSGLNARTNAERRGSNNVGGKLQELEKRDVLGISGVKPDSLPLTKNKSSPAVVNSRKTNQGKVTKSRFEIVNVADFVKPKSYRLADEQRTETMTEQEQSETPSRFTLRQLQQQQTHYAVLPQAPQQHQPQDILIRETLQQLKLDDPLNLPMMNCSSVAEKQNVPTMSVAVPLYQQPISEIIVNTVAENAAFSQGILTDRTLHRSFEFCHPQSGRLQFNPLLLVLQDEMNWHECVQLQTHSLMYGLCSRPLIVQVNAAVAACRLLRLRGVIFEFSQTLEILQQTLERQCEEWTLIKRRHETERIRMNLLVRQLLIASPEETPEIVHQIQELATYGLGGPVFPFENT